MVILGLALTLVSCEGEWGQKFLNFANDHSGKLSRDYAEANLKQKWARTFQEGYGILLTRLVALQSRLQILKVSTENPALYEEEKLFEEAVNLEKIYKLVLDIESERAEIDQAIKAMSQYCTNRKLYDDLDLKNVINSSLLESTLPEDGNTYETANSWIEAAVRAAMGLFARSDYEKQQDLFNQGIGAIRKNTIQGEELYQLSVRLCLDERPIYDGANFELEALAAQISKEISESYRLIALRSKELGRHLVPTLIERLSKKYQLDSSYNYVALKTYNYQFDKSLQDLEKHIDSLENALKRAPDKLEELLLQEKLRDSFATAIYQLDLFIGVERRPSVLSFMKKLRERFHGRIMQMKGGR